ncbi:MAG: hypothetical protein OEX77_08625 [Candidatus Bathyarchaeota archaeon]|nr:hypothetical protein [Candidatus Bathyarchaeota archaeon]MDH5732612.1 hypothetical protein [Candidatus Bathyarchaeota archaeon]
MANLTNRESSWKKREPEEKSSFVTHGLFGIIRSLHRKISRSKGTTVFSGYQTVEMFEDYQRKFELQKSKVIAQFARLQDRLI